jgi:hypothetical protein
MIRDIEEFRRLFRVNIPVAEHAAYYLETLARSPEYAGLPALADRFAAFERRLAERGATVGAYKHEQLDALRDALAGTPAFKRMCAAVPAGALPTRNRLAEHAGAWFVSLDLREANFSVLRLHDDEGALGEGRWADYCAARGVDPVLAESKSFRQLVFGHLEPKKAQKIQHALTVALADDLRAGGLDDAAIVMLTHDELIVAQPGDAGLARLRALIAGLAPRRPAIKATVFRSETIEPGVELRTLFESPDGGPPRPRHRTLVGVPGNLFFLYFKRHVLTGSIDPRDLYFRVEHRLAQWVLDDAP